MLLTDAVKTLCDFLFCFSFATLFGFYSEAWLPVGAVLVLGSLSSLILQKIGASTPAKVFCAILPALGLLTVKTVPELVATSVVLSFYFVLTLAGKNAICYEDYKTWFGFTAVLEIALFIVCVSKWPVRRLSVVCAAAYLVLGVLVLRAKRLGASSSGKQRLINLAEPLAVLGVSALAGTLLYAALKGSIDHLLLPFAYLFYPFVLFFEWIAGLLLSVRVEEPTLPETTSEPVTGEIVPVSRAVQEKTPEVGDYTVLSIAFRVFLGLLALAVLVYFLYLFYKMIRHLREKDEEKDASFEEGENVRFFGRERRKKRKAGAKVSNNEKIRRIYRDYLFFMKFYGVRIARQTTSKDVLAATTDLASSAEAERLRDLYIRARYRANDDASDEEVKLASDLLAAIKNEIRSQDPKARTV